MKITHGRRKESEVKAVKKNSQKSRDVSHERFKKYFIVSDVHSNWTALITPLKEAGYNAKNPDHILIIAGDLFDRGDDTIKIYKWIKKQPHVILIKGNHEYLLEKLIKRKYPYDADYSNGTINTLIEISKISKNDSQDIFRSKSLKEVLEWIQTEFVDYVEFDNYIITHAGYPQVEDYHNASIKEWDESTWVNPFITRRTIKPEKTLIAGHWGVSEVWSKKDEITNNYSDIPKNYQKIYQDPDLNVIGIDNTTIYTNRCLVYIIETDENPILGLTRAEHLLKEHKLKEG